MTPLLAVEQLSVDLMLEKRRQRVLHDVTFTLEAGQTLALVGESGSGKSMTAKTVAQLLPAGAEVGGSVTFDGISMLSLRGKSLRNLRVDRMGMIFQDPRAAINPVWRLGRFVTEGLTRTRGVSRTEALARAETLLDRIGIDDPRRRLRQYPHQVSGGMLQRMMIASVLLMEPDILLADEPTTALDVTTQSDVMAVLEELRRERGMAVLFITHDLELAAAIADRVAVIYAGYGVEQANAVQLRDRPRHPYTAGLLRSRPELGRRTDRIEQIPGRPVSAFEVGDGCPFAGRCEHVRPACTARCPDEEELDGTLVRCIRARELSLASVSTATRVGS